MNHALLKTLITGQQNPLVWLSETLPVVGSVSPSTLLIWVAKHSVLPKLRVIAKNEAHPLQGIADAAVILLQTNATLDVGQPDVAALVGALESAGVISPAQHAELLATATTQQPRWKALGLERAVDFGDILRSENL